MFSKTKLSEKCKLLQHPSAHQYTARLLGSHFARFSFFFKIIKNTADGAQVYFNAYLCLTHDLQPLQCFKPCLPMPMAPPPCTPGMGGHMGHSHLLCGARNHTPAIWERQVKKIKTNAGGISSRCNTCLKAKQCLKKKLSDIVTMSKMTRAAFLSPWQ